MNNVYLSQVVTPTYSSNNNPIPITKGTNYIIIKLKIEIEILTK